MKCYTKFQENVLIALVCECPSYMYCSLTLQWLVTQLIYVGSALDLHWPDINAYTSLLVCLEYNKKKTLVDSKQYLL